MELRHLINLVNKDVVSIVGAGGKTSTMFTLAKECRNNKILVTTSTKIYKPEKENYDYLAINLKDGESFKLNKNPGIYVLGYDINLENKLIGIKNDVLEDYYKYFDYIFIEADGSKGKAVKGWSENEPVILKNTTKTLGIVSIKIINKQVNEENVHRVDRFTGITGLEVNKKIGTSDIAGLILHKEGLFKNSMGKKLLFINQVETKEDINNAEELIKIVRRINPNYIDRIIIGSLKNKCYKIS